MKLIILSRDQQPSVDQKQTIVCSPDSILGQHYAELYGIVEFPAHIVVQDDGSIVQLWQGKTPATSEVSHWVHSGL